MDVHKIWVKIRDEYLVKIVAKGEEWQWFVLLGALIYISYISYKACKMAEVEESYDLEYQNEFDEYYQEYKERLNE